MTATPTTTPMTATATPATPTATTPTTTTPTTTTPTTTTPTTTTATRTPRRARPATASGCAACWADPAQPARRRAATASHTRDASAAFEPSGRAVSLPSAPSSQPELSGTS